jgi:hypothetical protein
MQKRLGFIPPARPLFDRLGGQPAITAVIDAFVAIVATDARIYKKCHTSFTLGCSVM